MIYDNKVLAIRMNKNIPPYCFLIENRSPQLLSVGECEFYYLYKESNIPKIRQHIVTNPVEEIPPFGRFISVVETDKINIIPRNDDVISYYVTDRTNQRRYCARFRFQNGKWIYSSTESDRIAPESLRYPPVDYMADLKLKIYYEITRVTSGKPVSSTVFLKNILRRSRAELYIKKKLDKKTRINELEISPAAFQRLKNNGIKYVVDIRKLGSDYAKLIGEEYVEEIAEAIKKFPDYNGFDFICGGIKASYSFSRFNTDKISSVIYDALFRNKTKSDTIFDRNISPELAYMLLIKGYFYICDIERSKEGLEYEFEQFGLKNLAESIEELTDNDRE